MRGRVDRSFSSGPADARLHWVIVKGHPVPVRTDEPISEGKDAVIQDGKARAA